MKKLILAGILIATASQSIAQRGVVDSLERLVSLNLRDTNQINAMLSLAWELTRKDLTQSREYLYKSATLSKALHNSKGLSSAYAQLATLHQNTGSPDSAKIYLGLLEAVAKERNTPLSWFDYYQTAGLVYKNLGKPKEAIPFLVKASEYSKRATNEANQAGLLLNIGHAYAAVSQISNAASYHLKALTAFEAIGNKRGQAYAYQGLGADFASMKQFRKAGTYYKKSYELKEELKDRRGTITSIEGLGDVEMELGHYKEAIDYQNKALALCEEMNLVKESAVVYYNLATIQARQQNIIPAREYFTKSLALARQSGDSTFSIRVKLDISELDRRVKNMNASEQELLASIEPLQSAGDLAGVTFVHHKLSELYASQNDYKRAYAEVLKYNTKTDSIRGGAVEAQLRALEEKYNLEKSEKEIALLKKDQELRTSVLEKKHAVQAGVIIALISVIAIGILLVSRYRALTKTRREVEMEKMRNYIARDLHDDIGSTLSSINIMSQLSLDGNPHPENFKKIADQSARLMESMSEIVWSINPENDSLEKIIVKMKEFAAEILEPLNINYKFSGEESLAGIFLNVEKRRNLFLIFKEAVNNAAKYSNATHLEIQLKVEGKRLSFSVTDNGRGFEMNSVKRGNGLKNMKERAAALEATFDFASQLSRGTKVALEVPIT